MSTLAPDRVGPASGPGVDRRAPSPPGRFGRWLESDSRSRVWLRRKAVAAWMNILIAVAAGITVATAGVMAERAWPYPQPWGVDALKLFALWCLSFLPGWLYVRFIGMRAKALWNEYVLNLHRLGWDRPENLPEPPLDSEFHDRWAQGGNSLVPGDNIYQQKFEAYYGRDVPRAAMTDLADALPG